MKNYWLDRWTEPTIKQVNDAHLRCNGQWYVSRQLKSEIEEYELLWDYCWQGQQMASGNYPDTYFLHSDGTWYRNSTLKNGKWTGYYDTRAEAEKAVTNLC
jgi:hypothetical protein